MTGRAAHESGPTITVRTRSLLTIVLLTALALLVSGAAAYSVQVTRAEQRATEVLRRRGQEVLDHAGHLASERAAFDPNQLLETALQRQVSASEGGFGIIEEQIAWVGPVGSPVRPEEDPQFVTEMLALSQSMVTVQGQVATAKHDYAYVLVPIRSGGRSLAALVSVIDLRVEKAAVREVFITYAWTAAGALLLVGAAAALALTRMLEPISWLRATAASIKEDDLSTRVPVRGHDDLSALASTMNRMLDRIETTVDDQRQLCHDVGHELRTPITIARGHLELMDAADPGDVGEIRAVTLRELDRMTGLAEDLLLLAGSDRPDFVTPQPCDIADLTREVLDGARVLGDRVWHLEEVAGIVADVDGERLGQAWRALASNAVKYSPAGTDVWIGSSLSGGEIRLWVRDQGVGIEPKDHDLVLSRFGRAHTVVDGKRPSGTGLGLAIVDVIARAHGGRVDIASVPGVGTQVTLVIPSERSFEPDSPNCDASTDAPTDVSTGPDAAAPTATASSAGSAGPQGSSDSTEPTRRQMRRQVRRQDRGQGRQRGGAR